MSVLIGCSQRLVNSQLRPTVIRTWLRDGWSVHEVVKVTRQHPATIIHYDPEAGIDQRMKMAGSIWGGTHRTEAAPILENQDEIPSENQNPGNQQTIKVY